MNQETMNMLKDALNKELAYYQQISQFLAGLPARFETQGQADNTVLQLISTLEIEGATRRLYRDHVWQKACAETKGEFDEARLSADLLARIGQEETARLLLKTQQWAYTIQRQLVKVVIFLKNFNRLNQQFLRFHDTLSNPAYSGRGLVRLKPGPRHMDQEV